MKKSILLLVALGLISFSLSNCGKMSPTSTIEGSGYPHNYPKN